MMEIVEPTLQLSCAILHIDDTYWDCREQSALGRFDARHDADINKH